MPRDPATVGPAGSFSRGPARSWGAASAERPERGYGARHAHGVRGVGAGAGRADPRGGRRVPDAERLRAVGAGRGGAKADPNQQFHTTVHPRVRGERATVAREDKANAGSSPRARGTQGPNGAVSRDARFIPACAGNACTSRARTAATPVHPRVRGERARGARGNGSGAVHPRVRGERVTTPLATLTIPGSSPRARGTRGHGAAGARVDRFIPACAGNASTRRTAGRSGSVHPRVRGERLTGAVAAHVGYGSSPRARGTLHAPGHRRRLRRFIPACAGNARTRTSARSSSPVHPRVRGERTEAEILSSLTSGSSPRARGTLHEARQHARDVRFIPACAGNARTRTSARCSSPVHPRVRGEGGLARVPARLPRGSSPRARGTRSLPRRGPLPRRFIPACAGNAPSSSSSSSSSSVHPRVRGERASDVLPVALARGSSPRARGTRPTRGDRLVLARFIPACAGNAAGGGTRARRSSVHPRVRGERAGSVADEAVKLGSSPRARGTLRLERGEDRVPRFIPACAGNAPVSTRAARAGTVHPRVRGERTSTPPAALTSSGSSPRARGTPLDVLRRRVAERFIPACAGNARCQGATLETPPVHPRVRGERRGTRRQRCRMIGSSPRARGTRAREDRERLAGRFIPACAGNASRPARGAGSGSVHPRVRGERGGRSAGPNRSDGSSPRARGTRRPACDPLQPRRFIPACAGNACSPISSTSATAVHPRVRGERVRRLVDAMATVGSSPRARGTPSPHLPSDERRRFIPACAGNAVHRRPRRAPPAVHPRVRGERTKPIVAVANALGSSPRARGTRAAARAHGARRRFIPACAGNARRSLPDWLRADRFIPACAGNAALRPARRPRPSVHPRVRGERLSGPAYQAALDGSSPRARGTPLGRRRQPPQVRFIPACAGNAASAAASSGRRPVHPRVRGERAALGYRVAAGLGSSPRARGTPDGERPDAPRGRFIPACAGNARRRAACRVSSSVHPRVRGERACVRPWSSCHRGSSPRARGTQGGRVEGRTAGRFIPACAGNAE